MNWEYPIWTWPAEQGWRAWSPSYPALMGAGRNRQESIMLLVSHVLKQHSESRLA